jgi:hypothetical protein
MADTPIGTKGAYGTRSSAATRTNGLSSAPARSEQDDDVERLRGIVALPRERDILFTDEVELDLEKLPRWQPHMIVNERRLADDEHD